MTILSTFLASLLFSSKVLLRDAIPMAYTPIKAHHKGTKRHAVIPTANNKGDPKAAFIFKG